MSPRDSLRLAIEDLIKTYGPKYPKGPEYLAQIDPMLKAINDAIQSGDNDRFVEATRKFDAFRAEAILASPLIDFDKLLLVVRSPRNLGPAPELAGQLRHLAHRLRQLHRDALAGPARR